MNKEWITYSSAHDESNAISHEERLQERERRSQTIPMPRTHVPRTNSEVQLREDTEAAEWRDLCMFYRVVNGIRERQSNPSSQTSLDRCNADDGVQITTKPESLEHFVAHYQDADEETSNVTPYESSSEASPHTRHYRHQAEGFLSQRQPQEPEVDEWSISGYEELEAPMFSTFNVPVVEDDDDDEEDCVFSMELWHNLLMNEREHATNQF